MDVNGGALCLVQSALVELKTSHQWLLHAIPQLLNRAELQSAFSLQ